MTPKPNKLEPCPFCGKPPSIRRVGGGDERNGYNFKMLVECVCGASISRNSHEGPGGWCDDRGEAEAEVTAVWNQRVTKGIEMTRETADSILDLMR